MKRNLSIIIMNALSLTLSTAVHAANTKQQATDTEQHAQTKRSLFHDTSFDLTFNTNDAKQLADIAAASYRTPMPPYSCFGRLQAQNKQTPQAPSPKQSERIDQNGNKYEETLI